MKINVQENERAASEWRKRYERETSMYATEIQRLTEEIKSKEKTFQTLQFQVNDFSVGIIFKLDPPW